MSKEFFKYDALETGNRKKICIGSSFGKNQENGNVFILPFGGMAMVAPGVMFGSRFGVFTAGLVAAQAAVAKEGSSTFNSNQITGEK